MRVIRAIVFDSNVFGREAYPNVRTIARWAEACNGHDAELWIPDVVAMELAEHAVRRHAAFVEGYRKHQALMAQWGLARPPDIEELSVEEVVGAIESAGAILVELDGEDARAAVMDQVAVCGAAERKSGVKTGAADSAWVRSVIRYNDGPDDLIVVTNDASALERTCAELDVDAPESAPHLGKLAGLLEDTSIADEASRGAFKAWLAELTADGGVAVSDLLGCGREKWWNSPPLPDDGFGDWELQDAVLSETVEFEICSDVIHDHWVDSLGATVRFTVDAIEQYARQDQWGNEVQFRTINYPIRVEGDILAFLDGKEILFDGQFDDPSVVQPSPDEIGW